MPDTHSLLTEAKSHCTDHHCPKCGLPDHVTAELVLVGDAAVTVCHCRVCGHSWHPHVVSDSV